MNQLLFNRLQVKTMMNTYYGLFNKYKYMVPVKWDVSNELLKEGSDIHTLYSEKNRTKLTNEQWRVFMYKQYAKIEFLKTDKDEFVLNKLENFKSLDNIVDEYGYLVSENYMTSDVYMDYGIFDNYNLKGISINKYINENAEYVNEMFYIGDLFTQEEVEYFIKMCKLAGENFGIACRDANKHKKISVEI